SFTQFVARKNDIKDHHSVIHDMLGERIIGFRSKSLITIANAISATELIGFLPQSLVDYYSSTIKLKKVSIPFTIAPVQLYLMYNRASMNNSGFTELIEYITKKHE
ncbi:LysR family transcriptional regulator, partial [Salmonella enterica]|nr:LysR family transcriptional regulator [Salmonella enterica]EEE5076988.1 LysR family transcriptional regulator [Salmonella enterica subsp. enterica serovar Thompson]